LTACITGATPVCRRAPTEPGIACFQVASETSCLSTSFLEHYYVLSRFWKTATVYQFRRGSGGIAPTYHIDLFRDGPAIVWDFHSLLRGVQMMFSFALTDRAKPLRVCPQCGMAFIAPHPNSVYCSAKCKNQNNVYKNRDKKKRDNADE
jgi:ribosomal protein S27AE